MWGIVWYNKAKENTHMIGELVRERAFRTEIANKQWFGPVIGIGELAVDTLVAAVTYRRMADGVISFPAGIPVELGVVEQLLAQETMCLLRLVSGGRRIVDTLEHPVRCGAVEGVRLHLVGTPSEMADLAAAASTAPATSTEAA